MLNENLTEGYGVTEACGSENLMHGAFSAGFGKTNAHAPKVAGLVCPRHYSNHLIHAPSTLPKLTLLLPCYTLSSTPNSFNQHSTIQLANYTQQTNTKDLQINLGLLHSYLSPFPFYRDTIRAPRQAAGLHIKTNVQQSRSRCIKLGDETDSAIR